MRRFMLTVASLIIGVSMLATAASAHVLFFDIDNTATLHNPQQAVVTGTIQCTAGEIFRISVVLTQDEARGTGTDRGTCTGDLQRWTVNVTATQGSFDPGPATACARVVTQEQGFQAHSDTLRTCEVVQLQPA